MQTPGISTEPQRRRRYTASFRQQVIEESLRNELSVARVAMKYGINANLLHTWRWHYRREQNRSAASNPAPEGQTTTRLIPAFMARDKSQSDSTSSVPELPAEALEVQIGAARILVHAGTDMAMLRSVIQALQP